MLWLNSRVAWLWPGVVLQ